MRSNTTRSWDRPRSAGPATVAGCAHERGTRLQPEHAERIGIVPGGAEGAEERTRRLRRALAAGELPAPAVDGPATGSDDRNRVGAQAIGGFCPPKTQSVLKLAYPIRKVTTPVPVEGGVAGGALPMSAGTSFQGRRKPNGSACHRRIMAGPARGAARIRAMSPLKSCFVEKPQPQRKMLNACWSSCSPRCCSRPGCHPGRARSDEGATWSAGYATWCRSPCSRH